MFIDLSKAYDNVNRNMLSDIITQRCRSEKDQALAGVMNGLTFGNTIAVVDSSFDVNKGVVQGDVCHLTST